MGILLVLFFPLGLWLARNGAKASEASRSAVQRQPKRAPAPGRSRRRIPKWLPSQSVVPSPLNTNSASCRKPKMLQPHQVASARCFAAKGLYSSLLANWRRERAKRDPGGLTPRKRGPKSKRNPLARRKSKAAPPECRLTEELRKAQIIIDVQKKVAALLGRPIRNRIRRRNS